MTSRSQSEDQSSGSFYSTDRNEPVMPNRQANGESARHSREPLQRSA